MDKKEHWMTCRWRPLCAIVYLILCVWDFLIAPICFSLLQYWVGGDTTLQWQPLTIIGGGLLHLSFGAILGVSAYSRGLEKKHSGQRYRYDDDEDYRSSGGYRGSHKYEHPYEDRR